MFGLLQPEGQPMMMFNPSQFNARQQQTPAAGPGVVVAGEGTAAVVAQTGGYSVRQGQRRPYPKN